MAISSLANLLDRLFYLVCTFFPPQAEEVSPSKRSTTAKLTINVKPVDSNPPVIHTSAAEGSVDENAAIGTKVVDSSGKPIRISVTDADLVSMNYNFVCVCASIINHVL